MESRSISRTYRSPRLKVYVISAPRKIVTYRTQTYRWGGKQTRLFVESIRPQPVVRFCLDYNRAAQQQLRLEQRLLETANADEGILSESLITTG